MGVRAMGSVSEATKRMRKPASGVLEWTARPLLDLKEQVGRLPSQLDRLSTDVELLEVLLDLHAASLLLHLGDLSDRDAALINMRIASSVWLPELSEALREAQDEVSTHRLRIERLDEAYGAGLVGDRARSILVDEYSAGMAAAEKRLARLTATADSWRDRGPTVLLACEQWVDAEIDLINARAIAEQGEQPAAAPKIQALDSERLSLLTREQERLSMAREALRWLR